MGYQITQFQSTPNPNAVKCILDRSISDHPRSFRDPSMGTADPTAAALFAIGDITSILMNDNWVTICKSPDVAWKPIKEGVRKVLAEAP